MGAWLSQQMQMLSGMVESDDEDSGDGLGGHYRYPAKHGHYFASHFIMGGERFDSPQPESFLFGENDDLNHLGAKPVAFPYPPPQANEPTKTLRSQINIRRDSVHFKRGQTQQGQAGGSEESSVNSTLASPSASSVKVEEESPAYFNLEFTFDSDVSCAITVHYFCSEEQTASGAAFTTQRPELTSETYLYGRGAAQVFRQPAHKFVPANCVKELLGLGQADHSPGRGGGRLFPLAIHCVSLEGDPPRQSHTTLAQIDWQEQTGTLVIKSLKQKLFVDGLSYFLQEIYGLENKVPPGAGGREVDPDDPDDCGAECVVCMSDTRDTLILPCRHLCLCNACADSLRYQANNCPICRAPFRALLQIRAVQKVASNNATHPAIAADPDVNQEGVPPGYQCVSLVEALNGPPSGVSAPTVTTHSVASQHERRKKKSSGKRRSSRSSIEANATAAATPASSLRDVSGATSATIREEDEEDEAAADKVELTSSRVSIRIVNETASGDVPVALESDVKAATSTSLGESSSKRSVDVVEEELAKMSTRTHGEPVLVAEAKERALSPKSPPMAEPEEDEEGEEDDDNETVVVNLRSSSRPVPTRRASAPGTPSSVASARSSQDSSASSSASTKELLPKPPSSACSVPMGAALSSSTPLIGVNAPIVVKVNPIAAIDDAAAQEDEDEDEEERTAHA